MELHARLNVAELEKEPNIATLLDAEDLVTIGQRVIHDYDIDLQSRHEWEEKNAESLKLAMQIVEQKTDPWPDCANVKFPLITIAAMQCHAREYPALISGTEIVKCRVIGDDKDGKKTARARRVAAHMSFQVLEEDSDWEEQMDRVMLTKPIVGTAFKKIYFDPALGHNVSEMILAQDLVIPYKAKSLAKAPRKTHVIPFSKNTIYERVAQGLFLNVLDKESQPASQPITPLQVVSDQIQGQHEVMGDADTDRTVLEQHRLLDLDGDGYAEPYIVTVDLQSKQVLRITARFFKDAIEYKQKGGAILRIRAEEHFIKYGMLPSPDGGIYDLGFGALLGPLNHTVNTIINQLLDAGTLSTLGGGFLGRGARLRRGQTSFKPGEWKQVDGTGVDLQKSVVKLPAPEPSGVLFQLLGLLVNYGERITGSTDIMSGQNVGQNTPASTAQELVKQGSVIFNSIFKRTYRSLRDEFRMLYRLNQIYLENETSFENLSSGTNAMILLEDYQGKDTDIRPAADPNVASVEKRVQQAMFLKQASMNGPGYKRVAVERRLLEAVAIPYLSEVWDENEPMPPQPKVALEQMKLEFEKLKLKSDMQYKIMELMQQERKIDAEVKELEAKAALEMAQAQGEQAGKMIALINTQIAQQKMKQDGLIQTVRVVKELMDSLAQAQQQGGKDGGIQNPMPAGGMGSMASSPSNEGSQAVSSVSGS
jgi:chaperonin GroES